MEMCTGPWKQHPNIITNIPLFFSDFFPYFTALFVFSIATPSIFGNAHWTLKKQCPTSSPTVSTIPYFFSEFSPILLLFFIWKSAHFLIWKCALDPENSARRRHQQWAPPLSSLSHTTAFPRLIGDAVGKYPSWDIYLPHAWGLLGYLPQFMYNNDCNGCPRCAQSQVQQCTKRQKALRPKLGIHQARPPIAISRLCEHSGNYRYHILKKPSIPSP